MPVQMTREEYQKKYGSQPVRMTRAEYDAKYGSKSVIPDTTWKADLKQGWQGALDAFDQGMERIDTASARPTLAGRTLGRLGAGFRFAGDTLGSLGEGAFRALPGGTTASDTIGNLVSGAVDIAKGVPGAEGITKAYGALPQPVRQTIGDVGNIALGGAGIAGAVTVPTVGGSIVKTTGKSVVNNAPDIITKDATLGGTANIFTQKGRQEIAENTMNRVARINPTDYNKFKKTTGKDTGAYLVERGIYGNDEEIVQKLTDDWMRSKTIVDDAFTEMGGTWRHAPVKDALEMLAEREAKVSTPNVKSPDFDTVQAFLKKYNTEGLTMSEVNEVKRLLERNVKLDYLKPNSMNPEKVTQATNVDNAIRTWQVDMADKLGLQNLRELNKNTQASRMLADSLYKKMTGQSGNNAIGLGDLVLLSGGDVRNIAMAGARKFFGSKSVQSKFAKAISPVKGKSVLPVTRGPITDPARRLPDPSFIPMGGKVQGDASFVRAVPAQNAVPERLMLNAGDTVSPINQGRAIPVMPRPINGDYLGKYVIAGRSTPKPQQTPRTPDQLRMPSATVKQGSPTQSTQLSTATRQGAQKSSSLPNSTPANASVATNVSDRELQAAKNVYLKSASADAFPQLAEKIKNARSFDEIAELIKTEGGSTSGLQYASNMSSRFKQELASLDDPAMIKRLTREQSTTQKGITQKVKDWYKASGLDDERGFIKVPYIRDDIGSYVQSNPRGRLLDVEARELFNIFKDEPTADESAMYVVRQFLSGKSGGGINRTELATALDILRNNAKKIYVAQRPAQRAPSNKSVMPKPKQKAEPKSKEKSLYSKIKDFLFPPGIPRDRGMVNLKAIADDLTGKTSKSDDLLTEARKYKTLEEFVKGQGTPVYHGGGKPFNSVDDIDFEEGFYTLSRTKNQTDETIRNIKSQYETDVASRPETLKNLSGKDLADFNRLDAIENPTDAQWRRYNQLRNKAYRALEASRGHTLESKIKDFQQSPATAFGEHVTEFVANFKKPLVYDAKGKGWMDISDGKYGDFTARLVAKARKAGNDGVIIRNINEGFSGKGTLGAEAGIVDDYIAIDKSAIKTRSQLTDLWNKAHATAPQKSTVIPKATGSADDALIVEARKYKTAEEFVKAKSGAFHGSAKEISGPPRPSKDGILGEGFYITDDADVAEWFGKQVNVPEDMQIEGLKKVSDSSIKPIVYSVDTSKVKLKELNNADGLMDALRGRTIQQLRKELLSQGFDGISLTKRGESIVFPESISKVGVKTRSQLTDIWNKAHSKSN